MAFDGVVGGMQGADALPLAGSIGDSPRPGPEGNVDQLPLELIRSTAFDNWVSHQLYRPAS
jgi:hypothetical protein